MVTVCRGAADWGVWMMQLEPPIEVMVGTVSTLTDRTTRRFDQRRRAAFTAHEEEEEDEEED